MPVILYKEEAGLGDGDPVVALAGTGTSIPRGVEAVFKYSDLILNDRTTVDKIRVTKISGLDDADVRDSRDDNVQDDGETVYPGFYGGRTLVFEGSIEAYTLNKLRDMELAMRSAFIDIRQEKPLHFLTGDGELDHFINCKKSAKLNMDDEQKTDVGFFRDFQVTVRASDPRFYKRRSKVEWVDPQVVREITVDNTGNYQTKAVVKAQGPITDFEIRVGATEMLEEQFFRLKAGVDIAEENSYLINGRNKTVTNKIGKNLFQHVDVDSDWLTIQPGPNTFFFGDGTTVGSTGSYVRVSFQDAYL